MTRVSSSAATRQDGVQVWTTSSQVPLRQHHSEGRDSSTMPRSPAYPLLFLALCFSSTHNNQWILLKVSQKSDFHKTVPRWIVTSVVNVESVSAVAAVSTGGTLWKHPSGTCRPRQILWAWVFLLWCGVKSASTPSACCETQRTTETKTFVSSSSSIIYTPQNNDTVWK